MIVASIPPITRKHERVEDVQDAQPLVIDGGHPLVEPVADAGRDGCSRGGEWRWHSDDMASSRLALSEASPDKPRPRPGPRRSAPSPASATRFDGVGILNPEPKIFGRIRRGAGGDGVAAHQVRQIRAEASIGGGAGDGVAVDAGGGFEDVPPGSDGSVLDCAACCWRGNPALKSSGDST